jgi:hypothetical protein
MPKNIASRIMSRTTLNIDSPILEEVKQLQRRRGGSLGEVVSQLLAASLALEKERTGPPPPFEWISKPMHALVDIGDREAVYSILDDDEFLPSP